MKAILKDYKFSRPLGSPYEYLTDEESRKILEIELEERLICNGEIVTAILIEDFYALSDRILIGLWTKKMNFVEIHGDPDDYKFNEEVMQEIEMREKLDEILNNWNKIVEVIDFMKGMEMDQV